MQTAATPAPSSTNLSDWAVGDEFRADGNRPMRITAIIPVELVAEFIEGRGVVAASGNVEPL